jgi:hypothetical protein
MLTGRFEVSQMVAKHFGGFFKNQIKDVPVNRKKDFQTSRSLEELEVINCTIKKRP